MGLNLNPRDNMTRAGKTNPSPSSPLIRPAPFVPPLPPPVSPTSPRLAWLRSAYSRGPSMAAQHLANDLRNQQRTIGRLGRLTNPASSPGSSQCPPNLPSFAAPEPRLIMPSSRHLLRPYWTAAEAGLNSFCRAASNVIAARRGWPWRAMRQ